MAASIDTTALIQASSIIAAKSELLALLNYGITFLAFNEAEFFFFWGFQNVNN